MQIRPILVSLRKHKIPALLIVLEIALACAVLCNAVFMIGHRLSATQVENAIDESGISVIQKNGTDPNLAAADIARDLVALRGIAGVVATAAINTMPLTNDGWNTGLSTQPETVGAADNAPNVAEYFFTAGGERALGLRLVAGRFFNAGEYATSKLSESYLPTGHVVILTQSLAKRLWPGQSALGKMVYVDTYSYTVVGVIDDVLRPGANGRGADAFHNSALFPVSPGKGMQNYVVRSAPQDKARVMREAAAKLEALAPNAVVKADTFTSIRASYFADTRSMVWMLALVCAVMLAVTAFGIVGLTSFWVGQRRRQIGIRRAVGATRGHIMQYFQTENFLLSTVGVAIGMLLAFGINLYLMQHYELERMPWYYLPSGAIALWLLGQLAVLGPALRAANVPPVVATRSV